MVNAKHDVTSYESCNCKREIFDANALYDAYLKAKQGSDWKPQVQKFEMTYLLSIAKIQKELENHTYELKPGTKFKLRERGKERLITGEQIEDRIVKHALCDEVLNPALRKYLIYDNGASLKGRGITFTRKRLETHLHKFYREYGNDGYILLMDFSKYYDNIRHDKLIEIYERYVSDETALWLLKKTTNKAKVDVSYMSDEEYADCMNVLFNSLEYDKRNKVLDKPKERKYMYKHLNIGDQTAQAAGIAYPIPLDNYIKIVRGVKYYGRYMDDSYVIDQDKEYLKDLRTDIIRVAACLGITVNTNKTRICRLSDYWRFLQIQYSLTDTGRVIRKINPKRLTTMKRKMKKLVKILPEDEFENWYKAWFRNQYKCMSRQQRINMDKLYTELKGGYENV